MTARAWIAALLVCLAAGCRDQRLQSGEAALSFAPAALDFGFVYRGGESALPVRVVNASRGRARVSWGPLAAPFFADGLPTQLEPGETELLLRFRPTEWGERTATLALLDGASVLARLPLEGVGQDVPECPTPVACHEAYFDLNAGECVERELADGTACDAKSVCVLDAACRAGQCVGAPRTCDDGDACTLDLCQPLSGCESVPAPPCPGAGPCTVGVCDPKSGCGTAPAADGTVCGGVSCDAAEVCVAGACLLRDPPDGFVCAEASPCQAEGVCQGSACARPAASPLAPSFSHLSSASTPPAELHDLLMERSGAMTLSGFYERPRLRINGPSARTLEAGVRRCLLWNDRLACADHLASGATGSVSLIELASGSTVWTFSLGAARPDFAALTAPGHLFMARLAVVGPDRLAALFEAYPKGTKPDTQCRLYFLVLLNAGGQMVFAEKLSDPSLETCDHPHPYGVAVDSAGNLFLAFSASSPGNAPLSAAAPTRLLAFSREGTPKWKRTEPFVAGELAVARGVLFPERGTTAFSTSSGAPLSVGGGAVFGRPVASAELFVLGPAGPLAADRRSLRAFRFNGAEAWTHALDAGESFASPELRVAQYRSSPNLAPRAAALAFVTSAQGELSLRALGLDDGRLLWSCPLLTPGGTTPPQLFEVGEETLGLMEGAHTCGDCDPPFALSSARFHGYALEGVSPALVPWPGTFGGGGHPHRETPLYSAGSSQ